MNKNCFRVIFNQQRGQTMVVGELARSPGPDSRVSSVPAPARWLRCAQPAERSWWIRNEFGVALGHTGSERCLGMDYGKVSGPLVHDLLDFRRLAGAALGLRGTLKWLSTSLFTSWPLKTPKNFTGSRNLCGFSLLYNF